MRGTEVVDEVIDTVRFLAAAERSEVVAVFTLDPAEFDLAFSVTKYRIP